MAFKVFLTGATGYIGGSALNAIATQHPEYSITVLLRNDPPAGFQDRYPEIEVLRGDFDSVDLISEAAAKANLVIHNGNSKHEPSIKAIIAGALRSATPSDPRYLIRLGGTGAIADWAEPTFNGHTNPKIWNDVADIDTITSLPDTALHRNIEKIIQQAAVEHGDRLKTSIICSCGVYGPGRGLGKTQSSMVPLYWAEIKNRTRRAFYTGDGGNTRSWVHIDDLTKVFVRLAEEAAAVGGGSADWGREGYYFTSTQEVSWLDFAKETGSILHKHKLIDNPEPLLMPLDEMKHLTGGSKWPHQAIYLYASNTRTRSERARKVLGYSPDAPGLFECLEDDYLAAVGSKP